MNRRVIAVMLAVGLALGTQQVMAQSIAPTVKTAATIGANETSAIKQFISTQVAALSAKDAADQSKARDALVNALGGDPSPAFVDAYAQAVNEAALDLGNAPEMRTRLVAAIIVARVADRSSSLRLKPAAIKFAHDKSEPVALWGVKAHRPLITAQLKSQPTADDTLIKGLVTAVRGRTSGAIAQEAYEALRLDLASQRANVTESMIKAVLPTMQDILESRIAMYKNGIPESPFVDTLATGFLVDLAVARASTPEQKVRTSQLVADLFEFAGARAASLSRDPRRDDIINTLKNLASAVQVIGDAAGKPAIGAATGGVSGLTLSSDGPTITKACEDVVVAIVANVPGVKRNAADIKPAVSQPTTK